MNIPDPSIYTDLQGLADLRRQARGNSREALEQVAQQFEALFLQMMLKSMREAQVAEGIMDNAQSEMYQGMFDGQLAQSLSHGRGIGIAETLVRQLQGVLPPDPVEAKSGDPVVRSLEMPERQRNLHAARPADSRREAQPVEPEEAVPSAATETVSASEPVRFDSPDSFVRALWPHAERAARQLGVDPRALVAQAALETGWGKAVISHPDGRSSHNLFNIKADHRWDGDRVAKQTLEYRDGIAQKERAWFRSYDSLAESFDDYVQFLQNSPRYRDALAVGRDAGRYVEGLQEAGYATDPAYATKIKRIISGEVLAGLGGNPSHA